MRAKAFIMSVFAVAALSFQVACGGGSGATCGRAPCGGDVVGNWMASSACIDPAIVERDILTAIKNACPSLSLGAVHMTPTGMLNLAADMTFAGTLAVNTTMDINYPEACLVDSSCATAEVALQASVGANGTTSASCVGTKSCTCTIVQTIDIVNATGTWATSGTTLTFAGAPGGNGPYCVQGSSLHLLAFDSATMTKIVDDIVLTKQ